VEGTIRSTFVVGADGKLLKVFPTVKVDGHVDQVLAVLGAAPAAKAEVAAAPKKAAAPAKKAAAKKAPAKKAAAKKKA
jgi:hypothetical protein